MRVLEVISESASRAFARSKSGVSLKFRCTSGPRKGQVRASPASCNAPINIKARNTMKQTRRAKSSISSVKSNITKRTSASSHRVKSLNKPRRRGRKI